MMDPNEIDRYIVSFPAGIQERLELLRQTIRHAAPDAREVISYGMPAFRMKKILVYFAAHKNHIGFYPTSSGIAAFRNELAGYPFSRGAIQFPHDKPLPLELVTRIVQFRITEEAIKKSG